MDYRTQEITRYELRLISKCVWRLFKCKNKFYFDVISAFELFPFIFNYVITEIVPDDDLDLIDVLDTTISYDETIGLSIESIKNRCKVSIEAARYRYNLDKKKSVMTAIITLNRTIINDSRVCLL